MEGIEEHINSLSDDQINLIYMFYDSGGYDRLMRYPHTIAPRLDMELRRNTIVEYLAEFLDSPDPDVPGSVLDGTCSFDKFCYVLQNQCVCEPLMHRLNQGTKNPDLGGSPVSAEARKDRIEELEGSLEKVHDLLKEMLKDGDPPSVLIRNDGLARCAAGLIEDVL